MLLWSKVGCVLSDIAWSIKKTHPCNIQRFFSDVKIENFIRKKKKKKIFFHIFDQNIDYGYTLEPPRRSGSNEYPQFMFWIKNKKVNPCIPQFCYIKVGFEGIYNLS